MKSKADRTFSYTINDNYTFKNISLKENFIFVIAVYFLLMILARIFISNSLELDEAEQFILTQKLSLGYNCQPPLYTWIQWLFFKIFGCNLFALAFLKNILLFLIYYFTYKSTKIITNNKLLASLSAAAIFLFPQISWEAQRDLTHSVLVMSIISFFIYYLLSLKYQKSQFSWKDYVFLGVISGLGLLSKYNFIIFLSSILIASFLDDKLKRFFIDKRILIAIIVVIFICLPHLWWFLNHTDIVIVETLNKVKPEFSLSARFLGIVNLIERSISFLAIFLLAFGLVFYKSFKNQGEKLLFNYFIVLIFLLMLLTIFVGVVHYKERWLMPLLFPIVVYLASKIEIKFLKAKYIYRFFSFVVLLMVIIFVVYIVRVIMPDKWKPVRFNYPFEKVAKDISNTGFKKGIIITPSKLIAGNMKHWFLDSYVINSSLSSILETDELNNLVKKYQQILIISDKTLLIDKIKNKLPSNTTFKKLIIREPYLYSSKNYYTIEIVLIEKKSISKISKSNNFANYWFEMVNKRFA